MGDFTDLASLIELADRSAPTASASIRCTPCLTTARAIAAPIRRTAGCFSTRSISTSKSFPISARCRHRRGRARLRAGDAVDYASVAALKWRALRAAFAAFKANANPDRQQDFDKFRAERGALLSHFACFEALRHKFGKPWWEWPEEWRQPDEARCAALRQGRTPERSSSSNSCSGPPTASWARRPIWPRSSA